MEGAAAREQAQAQTPADPRDNTTPPQQQPQNQPLAIPTTPNEAMTWADWAWHRSQPELSPSHAVRHRPWWDTNPIDREEPTSPQDTDTPSAPTNAQRSDSSHTHDLTAEELRIHPGSRQPGKPKQPWQRRGNSQPQQNNKHRRRPRHHSSTSHRLTPKQQLAAATPQHSKHARKQEPQALLDSQNRKQPQPRRNKPSPQHILKPHQQCSHHRNSKRGAPHQQL